MGRRSLTRNPIRSRGVSAGVINWRMASKTASICSSWPRRRSSSSASFRASSLWVAKTSRSRTKARMMWTLTSTARRLRRTLESMATPCSLKARGRYLECRPRSKIPKWNLRELCSAAVSWNMKSGGNRAMFRRTALFRFPVVTPYNSARWRSSITRCPRTSRIRSAIWRTETTRLPSPGCDFPGAIRLPRFCEFRGCLICRCEFTLPSAL